MGYCDVKNHPQLGCNRKNQGCTPAMILFNVELLTNELHIEKQESQNKSNRSKK
jgi:hypothetical protein